MIVNDGGWWEHAMAAPSQNDTFHEYPNGPCKVQPTILYELKTLTPNTPRSGRNQN